MVKNDEFAHVVEITKYKLYNSDEGCLNLKVQTSSGTLDLECFVHGETSAMLYRGEFSIGDKIRVFFNFLTDVLSLSVVNRQVKNILSDPRYVNNALGCNRFYIVMGRVITIYPLVNPNHPELTKHYSESVVDCGIYLHADIPKPLIVKVGDYIQISGRLDAHIIGKVEDKHER